MWATPAHASSMASSTAANILAVYDDAAALRSAMLLIPAMALHGIGHEQTSVGGTHCIPLSAANTSLRYHHAVRAYGRVKLVTRSVGEQDSSADGWKLVLHSEPCGSVCAVAFTAIEADLEAFSPGRAAVHDGHGRLAEGERAF